MEVQKVKLEKCGRKPQAPYPSKRFYGILEVHVGRGWARVHIAAEHK